jgi:hypothetical protein
VHPQFNFGPHAKGKPEYFNNDIALLKLDRPSTMPTIKLAPYKRAQSSEHTRVSDMGLF